MLRTIAVYFGKFVLAFVPAYIFARLGEMLIKGIANRISKPAAIPAPEAQPTKSKRVEA